MCDFFFAPNCIKSILCAREHMINTSHQCFYFLNSSIPQQRAKE